MAFCIFICPIPNELRSARTYIVFLHLTWYNCCRFVAYSKLFSPAGQKGFGGGRGQKGTSARGYFKGQKGTPGRYGRKGEPGENGLPGLPGRAGDPGFDGLPGTPGRPGLRGGNGLKEDKENRDVLRVVREVRII